MTLAERTYQALRRDIVTGALAPLHPLRMQALRQRYGVGFSPLREALNRLRAERLAVLTPQRGFRVAPLAAAQLWDATRTRILIESEALRLSIQFGGDAWESAIVAAQHSLGLVSRRHAAGEASETAFDLESHHHSFHRALISACRSNWLLDFAEKLSAETERYRYPVLASAAPHPPRPPRNVPHEHAALAHAALARDADLAVNLLTQHYRETAEFLHASTLQMLTNAAAAPEMTSANRQPQVAQ